jgi:hypothetical protein
MGVLIYGVRERFSIEIGPRRKGWGDTPIRQIDVWAANYRLTYDGNEARPSTEGSHLEDTIDRLLSDQYPELPYRDSAAEETHTRLLTEGEDVQQPYRFMGWWGSITSHLHAFLFRKGSDVVITVSFQKHGCPQPEDQGRVISTQLPERELLLILHRAAVSLVRDRLC